MKKPLLVANWKMHLGVSSSIVLAEKILAKSNVHHNVEIVLCPSFTALMAVSRTIHGSALFLGAQDVFWEEKGAYTGEVSVEMLREVGCRYVIIGHSERRQNLLETNTMVHQKTKAALRGGLTPIICVGETFDERSQGQTEYVVMEQVSAALSGISLLGQEQIVIAYEPVWVIGSGRAVEVLEAERVIKVIRHLLLDFYPREVVNERCRVLYGGSVDHSNVAQFIGATQGDGALIGGASLRAEEFTQLVSVL